MPATRKARTSGGGPATKGSQSTLSFGNRSRVTKAVTAYSKPTKDITEDVKIKTLTPEPESAPSAAQAESSAAHSELEGKLERIDTGSVAPEAVVEETAEKEARAELTPAKAKKSEEVRQAEGVSDAQVRRYWKAKEGERITARVHQEGLSVEEKVLRLFDMSSQYGPCIGISRMKRWARANKLGLSPPIEVLAVLLKEEGKGNSPIERAHVDELLSSKFNVGGS